MLNHQIRSFAWEIGYNPGFLSGVFGNLSYRKALYRGFDGPGFTVEAYIGRRSHPDEMYTDFGLNLSLFSWFIFGYQHLVNQDRTTSVFHLYPISMIL